MNELTELTQMVEGPPTMAFIASGGGLIREECGLVGHLDVERDRRQYLIDLGVNMTWAEYNCDTERWERCLMSKGVADLLEDLHTTGDFPHGFEVGPSEGELAWLKVQRSGGTERPELPLEAYLLAAPAEELDAFAASFDMRGPGASGEETA